MTASTTAATILQQRDSLQLAQVFHKNNTNKANNKALDIDDLMDDLQASCDATDTTSNAASDSEFSCTLGDGSATSIHNTNTGIIQVTKLEETLSHLDISAISNSNRETTCNSSEDTDDQSCASSGTNDSTTNIKSKGRKSVTFTDVMVREYPICLGDNPAVMAGAPLTISWEVQSEGKLSLDDYETSRPQRRRSDELRIPSFVRETMLKNSGYSRSDIQRGVRDVNLAKNMRKRTNETQRLHKAQEVAELLIRGTLNATVRKAKKRQERELIEHFRRTAAAAVIDEQTGLTRTGVRRSTWHATNSAA